MPVVAESRVGVVVAGGAAAALTATSVVASVVVDWTWPIYVESYTFTNTVIGVALVLSGVMIGWFRPGNRVGAIFAIAGTGHLVSAAAAPTGLLALEAGWPEPVVGLIAAVFLGAWTIGLPSLFMLALLLFPDGRVPSPRWRPVAWLILGSTVYGVVTTVISPEPVVPGEPASASLFALPQAPFAVIDAIGGVLSIVIVVLVVASLVVRYRNGGERVRRQLLWVILAVVAMLVVNLQRWITGDGPILLLLSTVLLPAAIAIAIVRHGLLDIRVALSRTLLYGVLIAVVIALYAGSVAVLTQIVPPEADRTVAVVVAVAVALAFNPLRLLLQRAVSRTFYGTRGDPARTAESVGERWDAATDLSSVVAALRTTLRFPRIAVVGADGQELAADGAVASHAAVVELPLTRGEDGVDRLVVTLRPGERTLHDADRRSLVLLAPLIGMLLRERRLVADLRAARVETAEARERERQILHRDLHDGLGPTLTSAALRIDAARNVLERDPARAHATLAHARGDVGSALEEVRRVVYGLRPIALDERGLVGALREQAAHPAALTVVVRADGALPRLSAAVELAAYRVASEGIANANRHSSGSRVVVEVTADAEALGIVVTDDGRPTAPSRPGVGIRSITERVEELGGTVSVGRGAEGWRIAARLPLRA